MLHGVEGRFDAQEFAQFLPRARCLAEGEQIGCVILFCGALCRSGNGALIIKGDDKFIAPVFKDGRGQSGLLKLSADRGNTGIAVFSTGTGIHDGLHLHIPGAEFQCSGQHFLDRALNALVVQKAGGIFIYTADLAAGDDHCG